MDTILSVTQSLAAATLLLLMAHASNSFQGCKQVQNLKNNARSFRSFWDKRKILGTI